MAFKALAFRPGVNTQLSKTLLGDGYSSSQLIRHLGGQPQKYGGWQQLTSLPLTGTCRALFAWSDLFGNTFLASGSEQKLQIFYLGALYDITPVTQLNTLAATLFATVSGSPTVTITDSGYHPNVGDWINIPIPVSIGPPGAALVVSGEYQVQTIDAVTNKYTITASSNAPSTSSAGAVPNYSTQAGSGTITVVLNSHGLVTGNPFIVHETTSVGGLTIAPIVLTSHGVQASPPTSFVTTVIDANTFTITQGTLATFPASAYEGGANNAVIAYYLPNGYAVDTPTIIGAGGNAVYGTGIYGAGAYGGNVPQTSTITPLRLWFLSSWGQTLIANPAFGALYYWIPPSALDNPLGFQIPAQVIAGAPTINTLSVVVARAQILVSLGSESGGVHYPNLIRWSDVSNYNDWTPTATNQAGSFPIPSGAKIVAAFVSGLSVMIWTDSDLWTMTYQGLPFVFSFQQIGVNCEAISAKSIGLIGQRMCWPSIRGFYHYDGASVIPLPCPVWDYFFNNIDLTQPDQVFCATNTLFTEFMWFFPFINSTTIGYVKFNMVENVWDIGQLTRTAWADHTSLGNPLGVDENRIIQQHEIGNDANGQAMVSSITTGYAAIGDGEAYQFIDAFWPDLVTEGTTPNMQITFFGLNAQNSTPVQYGPYNFNPSTEYVSIRIRGRLLGYTLSSNDTGSFWRVGKPYIRVAQAGRR